MAAQELRKADTRVDTHTPIQTLKRQTSNKTHGSNKLRLLFFHYASVSSIECGLLLRSARVPAF